jgi:hypothetical protein
MMLSHILQLVKGNHYFCRVPRFNANYRGGNCVLTSATFDSFSRISLMANLYIILCHIYP